MATFNLPRLIISTMLAIVTSCQVLAIESKERKSITRTLSTPTGDYEYEVKIEDQGSVTLVQDRFIRKIPREAGDRFKPEPRVRCSGTCWYDNRTRAVHVSDGSYRLGEAKVCNVDCTTKPPRAYISDE